MERYAAAVASGLAVLLEASGEDPVEARIPVPVPFPVLDSAERKTSSDEYRPAIVNIFLKLRSVVYVVCCAVRCVTAETNTRRTGLYTKEPTTEGIVHKFQVHNADDIVRGWSGAEAGSGRQET